MAPMKKRMTFVPSVSSVSIRFLSSTADSSWAVPSVASRSSIALTTPWTNRPTSHIATSAMMMISRTGASSAPRNFETSSQGGASKSGMARG